MYEEELVKEEQECRKAIGRLKDLLTLYKVQLNFYRRHELKDEATHVAKQIAKAKTKLRKLRRNITLYTVEDITWSPTIYECPVCRANVYNGASRKIFPSYCWECGQRIAKAPYCKAELM